MFTPLLSLPGSQAQQRMQAMVPDAASSAPQEGDLAGGMGSFAQTLAKLSKDQGPDALPAELGAGLAIQPTTPAPAGSLGTDPLATCLLPPSSASPALPTVGDPASMAAWLAQWAPGTQASTASNPPPDSSSTLPTGMVSLTTRCVVPAAPAPDAP